ncbi:MAG TPA: hypothetical protein VJU15_06880 [Gemmatimonadales bacterium]|nr:hypothetical protein [Gemmatimonadales bacterium]
MPMSFTVALFSALVLVVAMIVIRGFRKAGWSSTITIAVLFIYLVIPALLARSGALDRYSPPPPPALLLLLGQTILTVAIIFSSRGTALASNLALGAVVLLQSFRIAVELLLHRLYGEGVVPVQMTWSGRNLDIVTGITGLILGVLLVRGRILPRGVVLGWNVLGLVLLANIVGVAALSTPVPFRVFTEGPPNLLPSTLPWIWLPSFLVQVALGSHLLVFRMLRTRPEGLTP